MRSFSCLAGRISRLVLTAYIELPRFMRPYLVSKLGTEPSSRCPMTAGSHPSVPICPTSRRTTSWSLATTCLQLTLNLQSSSSRFSSITFSGGIVMKCPLLSYSFKPLRRNLVLRSFRVANILSLSSLLFKPFVLPRSRWRRMQLLVNQFQSLVGLNQLRTFGGRELFQRLL